MTALPQLVAAFHSLVGLAAVFVAAAALNAPDAFGIGTPGHIYPESLIEMSLGLAIGAITFTGSLIAFAKLQALMKGTPIIFKYQHPLNAALGVLMLLLIITFCITGSQAVFWLVALLGLGLGFLLIIPIGGADMPVVVSMLNSYSGWAACGIGFTIQNLALIVTGGAGRCVGRDPVLHHVQGHEPQHLQRAAGRASARIRARRWPGRPGERSGRSSPAMRTMPRSS